MFSGCNRRIPPSVPEADSSEEAYWGRMQAQIASSKDLGSVDVGYLISWGDPSIGDL